MRIVMQTNMMVKRLLLLRLLSIHPEGRLKIGFTLSQTAFDKRIAKQIKHGKYTLSNQSLIFVI